MTTTGQLPASTMTSTLRRGGRRGLSLLETCVVVMIISIISSMTLVNVGSTDASERVDRAAQKVLTAFRFARMQSMGHTQTLGASYQPTDAYVVGIDTLANTVTVYHATWNSVTGKWSLPGTVAAEALLGGGTFVVNLNTDPTCAGVVISNVSLQGTSDTSPNTSSPYYCLYRPFGGTENPGSASAAVTLSYGGSTAHAERPAGRRSAGELTCQSMRHEDGRFPRPVVTPCWSRCCW